MLAIDMPAGYSSLGGQVKNPYAPRADGRSRHSGGVSGGIELGGRGGGRSVRGFDRHRDFRLAAALRELERPRHPGVDRRADQPCRTRLNKVFDWGAGRYRAKRLGAPDQGRCAVCPPFHTFSALAGLSNAVGCCIRLATSKNLVASAASRCAAR